MKCKRCESKNMEAYTQNQPGYNCSVTKRASGALSFQVTTKCAVCDVSKVSFISKNDLPSSIFKKINF